MEMCYSIGSLHFAIKATYACFPVNYINLLLFKAIQKVYSVHQPI